MRIVYATDGYRPRKSGLVTSVDLFTTELARRGHQILIAAPWYPDIDENSERQIPGITILRLESHPLYLTRNKEDRLITRKGKKILWDFLDQWKPDLIHIQTEFNAGLAALAYAQKRNICRVGTSHTHFEEYLRHYYPIFPSFLISFYVSRRMGNLCNAMDACIAPTAEMRDVLLSYHVKRPIALLPTGLDKEEFARYSPEEKEAKRHELEQKYPRLRGEKFLLFVGRLGHEKNVSFLLRVFARVLKEFPQISLVLVGEGIFRTHFEEEARSLGIAEATIFTGNQLRSELLKIFALAEVFVFPSLTETQGLVTIEAMMAGTPVVAIGEMGTKAVMQGDHGGFMVPHDEDIFLQKLFELLGNPVLRAAKAQEALEHSQQFDIRLIGARLEEFYQDVLKNRHGIS